MNHTIILKNLMKQRKLEKKANNSRLKNQLMKIFHKLKKKQKMQNYFNKLNQKKMLSSVKSFRKKSKIKKSKSIKDYLI